MLNSSTEGDPKLEESKEPQTKEETKKRVLQENVRLKEVSRLMPRKMCACCGKEKDVSYLELM